MARGQGSTLELSAQISHHRCDHLLEVGPACLLEVAPRVLFLLRQLHLLLRRKLLRCVDSAALAA
jgi:hypothetical protein